MNLINKNAGKCLPLTVLNAALALTSDKSGPYATAGHSGKGRSLLVTLKADKVQLYTTFPSSSGGLGGGDNSFPMVHMVLIFQ